MLFYVEVTLPKVNLLREGILFSFQPWHHLTKSCCSILSAFVLLCLCRQNTAATTAEVDKCDLFLALQI